MYKNSVEQFFFSMHDFKKLFLKKKRSYLKSAIGCFSLGFLFFLAKEPQYEADATFKKAAVSRDMPSHLKNFLSFLPMQTSQTSSATVRVSVPPGQPTPTFLVKMPAVVPRTHMIQTSLVLVRV